MDEYAGRVLADRYRLPRPPADEFELVETRAFDTYSGQEVLVHQVLLPEVVTAETADTGETPEFGGGFRDQGPGPGGRDTMSDSARRALEAARAAAAIPDHPRLVQVFDIFVEDGSLWIASELVSARPLAALLADRPLDAYRAAEVASDVLTALRALHAYGWTHRNVTASTVLVCDDGRSMLAGLAAGAAQEALCGYDPVPEQVLAGGPETPWHGPESALEQERARQNRITVVGAVTERWAPEQAHEVHENWRLSPPVGPSADLWALGSLLFRSVQGHPPFPEESAAELVQLVCAEPPAYAEECGALRPIVESLLRPDPEERPEAEELGGWLRSLIRSAPEPDLGIEMVQVPTDPARLPIVRRKGELVRRRRKAAAAAAPGATHRRHARGKQARVTKAKRERVQRGEMRQEQIHREQVVSRKPAGGGGAAPRRLGVRLLVAVLVVLAAVVLYALLVMPGRNTSDNGANGDRSVPAEMPGGHGGGSKPSPTKPKPSAKPTTQAPTTPASKPPAHPSAPPDLGTDFAMQQDPAGFTVAVHTGWSRTGKNGQDEVRYAGSDLQLTVVPGRDTVSAHGNDPLAYQLDEPELATFRASSWSAASNLHTLDVRGNSAAEGEYSYRDGADNQVFTLNLAVIIDGRYHLVLVTGPDSRRADVQRAFDKAVETYTTS
ncbi:protein tyrosine kinase [Streptomyces sp. NPDC051976]|uniref:serine/threonine protein kinase n=1 Tax=Streptomyces sp. NPDC051976 TaxID=3154947 RepID=UPI00342570D1